VELKEMMSALKMTNKKMEKSISEDLLQSILGLVINNPLEKDRLKCQGQIESILLQKI